jgi:hypothetical protein
MKKVAAVVLCLMLASGFAVAQDFGDAYMKGSIQLGGSFSFSMQSGDYYENSEGDGATSFSIRPDIGYFVADGVEVGGLLGFNSYSQGDYSSSTLSIGPFVNYYFPLELGPGHPYATLGYLYQSRSSDDGTNDTTSSFTSLKIGVGYDYPLNEHVSLYGLLDYNMDTWTPDGGDGVDGTDIGLFVGFKFFHF